MNYKTYAGIGSRQTPVEVLSSMAAFAGNLEKLNWVLRSGGANGADSAFASGVMKNINKEIFLPFKGFNGKNSDLHEPSTEAMQMAESIHPAWHNCSRVARLLHARNSHQIFGQYMDNPVKFVICWTPDGRRTGGTGQALRIAEHFGIPIFDMGHPDFSEKEVEDFVLNYGA